MSKKTLIFVLIAAAFLCMFFVGCGKKADSQEEENTSSEVTSDTEEKSWDLSWTDNEDVSNVLNSFHTVASEYKEADGTVKPENMDKALDAIYQCAEQNRSIRYKEKNENYIYMTFKSGEEVVYALQETGDNDTASVAAGPNKFITCDIYDFWNYNDIEQLTYEGFTNDISGLIKNTKFDLSGSSDNENLIDKMVNLSEDRTQDALILMTHGLYTKKRGCVLDSGVSVTLENMDKYSQYLAATGDNTMGFFLVDSMELSNTFLLFPSFFENHLRDNCLNDVIVYLGACWSGRDTKLGQAFLDKGAAAVLGYTEETYIAYVTRMLDIFKEMCQHSSVQGDEYLYKTVGECMDTVKNRYALDGRTVDNLAFLESGNMNTNNSELILIGGSRDAKLINDCDAIFDGGSGTKSYPYVIKSSETLTKVCLYNSQHNYEYNKLYISLENDVVLENCEGFGYNFSGNFNGNGHTITINEMHRVENGPNRVGDYYGLFSLLVCPNNNVSLYNSDTDGMTVVRNLTLSGDIIMDASEVGEYGTQMGIFVLEADTPGVEIENCINRVNITAPECSVGCIGMYNTTIINRPYVLYEDCRNYGNVNARFAYGIASGTAEFQNCANYGNLNVSTAFRNGAANTGCYAVNDNSAGKSILSGCNDATNTEYDNSGETAADSETEEKASVSIGGIYENIKGPSTPGSISYVITVTLDGESGLFDLSEITKNHTVSAGSGLTVESDEWDVQGDTGYIYLTVSWKSSGNYNVQVSAGGESCEGTITAP